MVLVKFCDLSFVSLIANRSFLDGKIGNSAAIERFSGFGPGLRQGNAARMAPSQIQQNLDPNFASPVMFQLQIVFIHASLQLVTQTNFLKICVPTPEILSVRISETSRLV